MKCKSCGATYVDSDCKWLKIPELNIEVEMEVHDKGKPLNKVNIPKGCRLPILTEAIWLANSKYVDDLKMRELSNDFFIEQPFRDNNELVYALVRDRLWGGARGHCFYLLACRLPSSSASNLGLRLVRELRK